MSMEMDINADDASLDDHGDSMDTIYRGLSPWELNNLPDVVHSSNHTVLFNLPLSSDETKPPKPFRGHHKWDSMHVRMPCSPNNQYPVSNADGTEDIKSRWALIVDTFDRDIASSKDLEAAILTYNTRYNRIWKFRGLHAFCEDMDDEGRQFLFDVTVPYIIRLALQLPEVLPSAVPLLKSGRTASVSFSQQQISSLLANAFLCTFPRRNTQKRHSEYRSFPDINFNRLFDSTNRSVLEKLKCILHYFQRVSTKVPTGVVTIARRCWDDQTPAPIRWSECTATFGNTRLHVSSTGTIEDQGVGLLQVDFANKFLGGGVLGQGCVQEEIRFVICPELFITKLVAEVMQPHEAIFMVGCERFSAYSGYASSFTFDGEFIDNTPFDGSRRRCCSIVAIDALNFHRASDQYRADLMHRELDKAHVGYGRWLSTPAPGVATGNWGCGAFGGDKRLKALLQLMVCCVVSRPLVYYTFGDRGLARDLLEVFGFLKREQISVGKLWSYLKRFRFRKLDGDQLFPFIYQSYQDEQSNVKKQSDIHEVNRVSIPTGPVEPSTNSSDTKPSEGQNYTWPYAKKKTPSSAPSTSSSSYTKPKPYANPPVFGLLACLDQDYSQQNQSTSHNTITENSPPTDTPKDYHCIRSNNTYTHTHNTDDVLCEVLSEEPPTVDVIVTNKEHNQSSSRTHVASSATDGADNEFDNDDGSVISATPTPPDRRRFNTPSGHKRQSKISDFLREK